MRPDRDRYMSLPRQHEVGHAVCERHVSLSDMILVSILVAVKGSSRVGGAYRTWKLQMQLP